MRPPEWLTVGEVGREEVWVAGLSDREISFTVGLTPAGATYFRRLIRRMDQRANRFGPTKRRSRYRRRRHGRP
jgi:hypothetical protein